MTIEVETLRTISKAPIATDGRVLIKLRITGALAVLFAVVPQAAISQTTTTANPDVVESTIYKCTSKTGAVEFTADATKQCPVAFKLGKPSALRPGLVSYVVLGYDDRVALFYSKQRFRVKGTSREAWVIISYSKPQVNRNGGSPWTRLVEKYTVDCQSGTAASSAGTFYAVGHGDMKIVGSEPESIAEEPAPGTLGDNIVQGLCGLDVPTQPAAGNQAHKKMNRPTFVCGVALKDARHLSDNHGVRPGVTYQP